MRHRWIVRLMAPSKGIAVALSENKTSAACRLVHIRGNAWTHDTEWMTENFYAGYTNGRTRAWKNGWMPRHMCTMSPIE